MVFDPKEAVKFIKSRGGEVKGEEGMSLDSFSSELQKAFAVAIRPLIDSIKNEGENRKVEIKELIGGLQKMELKPQITVEKPDPVKIEIPEIKIPEQKAPIVNVEAPIITPPQVTVQPTPVNFPDFPKVMKVEERDTPLPVMQVDRKGVPVSQVVAAGSASGGGSTGKTNSLLTEVANPGKVSENNSSTALLGTDEVFTGVGDDVSQYASVSILYKSDVAAALSGLSIQFSQDNTNWDVQLVGDLGAKTFQVHRLVPAAQFFRVVYTNGSAAQGLFRLQCIFHKASTPVLITRGGQPQSTVDATPTRQVADIDLDFARKHIPGGRSFFFFGHNDDVDTAYEDIYPGGGNINWLQEAVTVEVNSSDAADTSAGAGVRSVEIHGLSATGADQDEVIVMAGTATTESALTYVRVNKMHNETVGTYGGSHKGDISCFSRGGVTEGVLLSKMVGEEGNVDTSVQYGLGEASNGFWSVPLGKVMYITHLTVNVQIGTNKTVDMILYEREGILDTSAPMDPRRIIWNAFGVEGVHDEEFKSHIKIKSLTDIFFRAKAEANGTRVDVKLHYYLVDADADGA